MVLPYLNTCWFLVGSAVWGGLGGAALLEEACVTGARLLKPHLHLVYSRFLLFVDVISQLSALSSVSATLLP